jgi:hypothetical protein
MPRKSSTHDTGTSTTKRWNDREVGFTAGGEYRLLPLCIEAIVINETIVGRRVDYQPGDNYPFPKLQSGDYGKDKDGVWHCVPPGKDPFIYMGCFGRWHKLAQDHRT